MKIIDKSIVLNKIKQIMHYKEREAKQFICECLNLTLTEFTLRQGITKKQYFLVYKCIILTRLGKPINKILKRSHFYGRTFYINKHVLAPRQETELVVDYALSEIDSIARLKNKNEAIRVLDLCTGSGVIGITIAKQNPKTKVTIADISKKALKVAQQNSRTLQADVNIVKSNMFDKLESEFDVIVCNPPYITEKDYKNLPKSVKNYDPKIALVGGCDGLEYYKIIKNSVKKYLANGGSIILEIGYNQKNVIKELFAEMFASVEVYDDYEGNPRVALIKGEKV